MKGKQKRYLHLRVISHTVSLNVPFNESDCAPAFIGHDHSPEGGALWLLGKCDPRTDEEYNSVWRLRDQRIHQGTEEIWSGALSEELYCPLSVIFRNCIPSVSVITVWFLIESKCLFQGLGTDEETLIEILCSRSNTELLEIKQVYRECKFLNKSLECLLSNINRLFPKRWLWMHSSHPTLIPADKLRNTPPHTNIWASEVVPPALWNTESSF